MNNSFFRQITHQIFLKGILYLFLIVFPLGITLGQSSDPSDSKPPACATDLLKRLKGVSYQKKEDSINNLLYLDTFKKHKRAGQTYVIPVVFHIVHNGGPENISDSRVIKCLKDLNEAFSNTGVYAQTAGINTNIQFCLAVQDPDGNLTSGITRTISPLTNINMENQDMDLKDLIRWPPQDYLNVWIINEINSLSSGPGVAGYAYFPSSHGGNEDGIVVEAQWTGTSTDYSKVLIHEAGHYLGCYHTFEGGCTNNNCLMDGDHVCDTPPDASTNYVTCGSTANTCTGDEDDTTPQNPFRSVALGGMGDQMDMTTNYMDYNDLACVNIFTQGQKDRMIPAISIIRKSLLQSKGCKNPCTSSIAFSISPLPATKLEVLAGQSLTFTNVPQINVTYDWDFGDGATALNTVSPSKIYSTPGIYKVICKASNSDPNCTAETYWDIVVKCPVESKFTSPSTNIPTNTSLTFTNLSTGASSYKWFIDGIDAGTTNDLTYNFNVNGAHFVQLIACSGLCCDTSDVTKIQVGNCKVNHAGDVWCYGSWASVDFASGIPVAVSKTSMNQSEGVASISDDNGKLLFYTNGQSVWTADHTLMPNGTGLNGSGLSSQSSIITPFPGNADRYCIFTVHDWQEFNSDLSYSVVDMSLNGGKGSIVAGQKNITLQNNIAERVTAVYHKNCKDIWIISHEKNNNKFVAYLLTSSGINPIPVITNTGSMTSGGNRYGYLRVSHDSRKLCSTLGGSSSLPTVELFDFDNETGTVSSPVTLETSNSLSDAYSSEFSPDNRILYVTEYDGRGLYQYNLYAGTPGQIAASRLDISTTSTTKPSVQMGPDSKIYYVTYYGLGAINNPNALGMLSNATDDAVFHKSGTYGNLGLPNFIPGLFGNDISIAGPSSVCQNSIVTYEATSASCIGDVTWTYKGTGSIVKIDKTKITIDVGSIEGMQSLTAETPGECGIISYMLNIEIEKNSAPKINLGADTAVCGTIAFLLDAGNGFDTYYWSDGSTTPTLSVTKSGTYCVTVTNSQGCVSKDCITIKNLPPFSNLNIIDDQLLCNGNSVKLDAGTGYSSYKWSTGSTNRTISTTLPGKYWVNVITPDNCEISDTINITEMNTPTLELGPDIGVCKGEVFELNAGAGFKTYQWQTPGYTSDKFTAYQEGKYWVTVTDTCGTHSDTVNLTNNCPLPLNILYFNGTLSNNQIKLNYKVNDIISNSVIYIQKSKDGVSFKPINESFKFYNKNSYVEEKFYDSEEGYQYYQLVIKTSDNKYTFSKIIHITPSHAEAIVNVYPNPSDNSFNIQFNTTQEKERIIQIHSIDGKLIKDEKVNGNILTLSTGADLNDGVYILSVIDDNSTTVRKLQKIKR
ncbi:MAG: T9SS type A sorting domain-containing protein [Sporocytophaga sp.]|uniref:M43 family zinc metalloprotease n=1 Tax=Sporocytophaga sp. TaxID=2231183 RepID=UPI001B1302B0|nr:M43 family zinc metalloprotease [Sporocytophaga sp.]MBO9703368.1 T9SS type A sorting domain-containing protein [Sporocytophaga sp.]